MSKPDFEQLWRDYHANIYDFIRRRVQTPGTSNELAEDLCQECFAKALEAMQRGTEVTHASGWLHRIARNLVIDHYRQRDHLPTFDYDDAAYHPARELSPHEQAESAIGCAEIWGAVERLPKRQAAIIALRAEGCDAAEMAEAMGRSDGAAKAMLHRGRVRLKHVFIEGGYEL